MRSKHVAWFLTASIALFTLAPWMTSPALGQDREKNGDKSVALGTPRSVEVEHEELHAELVKATKAGGKTAEAARAVAKLLHQHFVKEEEYAMPLLGLLAPLAEGKAIPEAKKAIDLAEKLKAELPQMLEEHRAIVAALKHLADAAKEEGKERYIHFAEKLMLHAQAEEEVMYPAAILVGECLKLKPKR